MAGLWVGGRGINGYFRGPDGARNGVIDAPAGAD